MSRKILADTPIDRGVSIRVQQDKMEPILSLMIYGYGNLKEAKKAVVDRLRDEGVDGDGGTVESIDVRKCSIGVITDTCGLGINNMDIEEAIKKNGDWHVC